VAFGLAVAACGSSPTKPNPSGTAGGIATEGNAGGESLAPGLSAVLAKLDSYQFSWTLASASSTASTSPDASASPNGSAAAGSAPWISGTVINKGTKSYRIDDPGMVQFIVIGDKAWTSIDSGKTWAISDVAGTDLTTLTIDGGYATWFDKNAASFKAAGDESKNGVACVRYEGDSSLIGLYAGVAGASSQVVADLWIAKDGGYPVSGVVSYSGSVGGKPGSFGYSFDITHINDSANSVTPPGNILAEPTDTAST
jgi:hypothetical protein